jgi:carboxyl-terminal processing protease
MRRFALSPPAALAFAGLTCLIALPSLLTAETRSTPATRAADMASANVKPFDEAWGQVRDSFYDPNLKGLDWSLIGRKYRSFAGDPKADVPEIINRMLSELGASHTGYYTPDEVAYYDLADIFSGALRHELKQRFPDGEVAYDGIGMATRVIEGRHFISGVFDGFPAAKAGLMVGDEIISADGKPFAQVRSFAGKTSDKVHLAIRREPQGSPLSVDVVAQALKPSEAYLAAMRNGARVIEKDGRKLGYVHIWS